MNTRFALAAVALIGTAGCVPALPPLAPSSGDSAALYARAPGDRVRITLPAAALDRQEVALLALTADSLVVGPLRHGSSTDGVVPGRERFAFSRDAVQSVEVMWKGRRYYALVGAVVGYVAGAAIANGVGARHTPLCDPICPGEPKNVLRLLSFSRNDVLIGVGGVTGALLGYFVGRSIGGPRWVRVPLDRLRVGLAPMPSGRLGPGAALAF